jgi:hypothetical protein
MPIIYPGLRIDYKVATHPLRRLAPAWLGPWTRLARRRWPLAQALLTREKQNPSNLSGSRASYIREIVPGERRIEIRQRLEGENVSLHLFAIRVLEDETRYEVKLSGDAEHKTVKPPEWLSLLHDKLARIVAKILYARETSKSEKQDLDLSGPAA